MSRIVAQYYTKKNSFCKTCARRNQGRQGRDCLDVDIASAGTSAAADVLVGLQDVPTRLNKQQLTPTEYALQEIRYMHT